MNRTFRTTAAALGAGALLAGGLAVGTAVAAPDEPATGVANSYGPGGAAGPGMGQGRGMTQARGAGGAGWGAAAGSATPAATATATPELADALAFAREEERMARDLYAAIADAYDGARPFSMITTSEQRHFDAVGTLLERYGVEDPAADAEPGVYESATIQGLYDAWWAEAQTSLDAAYQVGVELEQRDIADLEEMLAADYPSDVDDVLAALLQGSRMHLAAYERAADGQLGQGIGPEEGMGSHQGLGHAGAYGTGHDGDCPMDDADE